MSRPQPALKNEDVETIDLTGSPEPPARPQTQTRRPQQSSASISNFAIRQGPSSGARNVLAGKIQKHAPNPPISPDHLRTIINHSPSHVVNSVLLELCKLSPALSGAVVRSLSPHSKYAQDLIRRQGRRILEPQIKRDPGSSSSSSFHRAPKEPRTYDDPHDSKRNFHDRHSSAREAHYARYPWVHPANRPSSYRPSSHVKRDHDDVSAQSDSESESDSADDYFEKPKSRPAHPVHDASQARHSELRRREEANASRRREEISASKARTMPGQWPAPAQTSAQPSLPGPSSSSSSRAVVKPEPSDYDAPLRQTDAFVRQTLKTCNKCYKSIHQDDFSSTCICHPGRVVRDSRKGVIYECCQRDVEAPGCSRAYHHVS